MEQTTQYSAQELREMLAKVEAEENNQKAAKRQGYEAAKNEMIDDLGDMAKTVNGLLTALKAKSMEQLAAFRIRMLDYGDLRHGDKNKGSFEIRNERYKISFKNQITKRFDERAELAEQRLKEFLFQTVKKRDQKLYRMITSLLERNEKSGDFDINLINRLYAMEDQFDDENWKEAISLFKESYSPTGTAQYIRFSKALPGGGWESVLLDFPSIRVAVKEPTEA